MLSENQPDYWNRITCKEDGRWNLPEKVESPGETIEGQVEYYLESQIHWGSELSKKYGFYPNEIPPPAPKEIRTISSNGGLRWSLDIPKECMRRVTGNRYAALYGPGWALPSVGELLAFRTEILERYAGKELPDWWPQDLINSGYYFICRDPGYYDGALYVSMARGVPVWKYNQIEGYAWVITGDGFPLNPPKG
jgi:hypothetical protein